MPKPSEWLAASPAPSEPIVVYTGPTRTGAALLAAVAADADRQATPRRGKKSHVVAKKPDADEPKADNGSKADAKPAKPAAVRHASAKPDASAKSAAAPADTAKPAKPKATAKPKADSKPAQKGSSSDKPAS